MKCTRGGGSSSPPGSRRERTCTRARWPEASRRPPWRSEAWRGPPASSTLWPSSGNQRRPRTTPGSTTSTATRCPWDWGRKRRSGPGKKPPADQRGKPQGGCRGLSKSTPMTPTAASPWTPPYSTCSCRRWWRARRENVEAHQRDVATWAGVSWLGRCVYQN